MTWTKWITTNKSGQYTRQVCATYDVKRAKSIDLFTLNVSLSVCVCCVNVLWSFWGISNLIGIQSYGNVRFRWIDQSKKIKFNVVIYSILRSFYSCETSSNRATLHWVSTCNCLDTFILLLLSKMRARMSYDYKVDSRHTKRTNYFSLSTRFIKKTFAKWQFK